MATCYPCSHTVDEKTAPHWKYKETTFYFCSVDCEEEVKNEPEKWLKVAKSPSTRPAEHDHHHH